MSKTGSSSIQKVLQGYGDDRIAYADLGLPNHSVPLMRAFTDSRNPRLFKSADPELWEAERAAARELLRAAVEAGPRSLILSGEDMWAFFPAEACRRCADFLRARFARVEALVYLRSPQSYARSAFQERLKKAAEPFNPAALVPPYRERGERWAQALGGHPTYLLYHRARLAGGDVVVDFAGRLGLDPAWVAARNLRFNETLSAEATAVLYLIRRRHGAPMRGGAERRANRALIHALLGFGTRRFAIAPEVLAPHIAARAADIAWAEERLGACFPAEAAGDAVVFASEDDILALAAAQAAPLAEHLRRLRLIEGGRGATVEQVTDALLQRLCRKPPRPAWILAQAGQPEAEDAFRPTPAGPPRPAPAPRPPRPLALRALGKARRLLRGAAVRLGLAAMDARPPQR
jgi:hypothetical protein